MLRTRVASAEPARALHSLGRIAGRVTISELVQPFPGIGKLRLEVLNRSMNRRRCRPDHGMAIDGTITQSGDDKLHAADATFQAIAFQPGVPVSVRMWAHTPQAGPPEGAGISRTRLGTFPQTPRAAPRTDTIDRS